MPSQFKQNLYPTSQATVQAPSRRAAKRGLSRRVKHHCRSLVTAALLSAGLAGLAMKGPNTHFTSASARPQTVALTSAPAIAPTAAQLGFNPFRLIRNAIRYIQVRNISDREEVEIGRQINQNILSEQYQRYDNESVNRYVTQLGQQLAESGAQREIPYQFQVLASDDVNAFATPGGYVYVTTGLLATADNEAQLASVIAHEIAHIDERHSIEALQQTVLAQGIADTVGVDTSTLAQVGYQLAFDLPRGREAEYEADKVGLRILQAADYPPTAFVNFLEKLKRSAAPPEFLSTHPTSENRIESIREKIQADAVTSRKGRSEAAYQQAISPLG